MIRLLHKKILEQKKEMVILMNRNKNLFVFEIKMFKSYILAFIQLAQIISY